MKVLLLKRNLFHNFFFCKGNTFRCHDPFFFYVIKSVNNCNDTSDKFCDWHIYPQNVCILFFSVRCHNTGNISIVNGILNICMLGVECSKRPVNNDSYNTTNHRATLH